MRGLSLVVASGGHSSSWCTGLSLSRPLLLWSTGSRRTGSVVVAHGPSCSAACGILPDQGSNPCPLHRQADSQPQRHQGSPFSSSYNDPSPIRSGPTLVTSFNRNHLLKGLICKHNHNGDQPVDLGDTVQSVAPSETARPELHPQTRRQRQMCIRDRVKNLPADAGDTGSCPGPGRSHMPQSN